MTVTIMEWYGISCRLLEKCVPIFRHRHGDCIVIHIASYLKTVCLDVFLWYIFV